MFKASKAVAAPVVGSQRIIALDILRGVALLGILFVNINGLGTSFLLYFDPEIFKEEGINLFVFQINALFFEGTMRGLFSLLFGAGFLLLTSRLESKDLGLKVADIYYRRLIWLIIFGLIHAYVILWCGDILFAYGIVGLLLFPLRNMKPLHLFLAGVVIMGVSTMNYWNQYQDNLEIKTAGEEVVLLKNEGAELSPEQDQALAAWETLQTKPGMEGVEMWNTNMRKGYAEISEFVAPFIDHYHTTKFIGFFFWDVLSFFLIGMAFLKWGVITGGLKRRFYLLMVVVGYGVGLGINFYELDIWTSDAYSQLAMSEAKVTYDLGRFFMTLGHIGVIMLMVRLPILNILKKALAGVGRMALTNYIMQSVICGIIFYGFGFGLYGTLERHELYYVVFSVWLFQLIISPIWLNYFKYGPLEWLWRSLTYKKLQEFRR